jgi:hypothetical protein
MSRKRWEFKESDVFAVSLICERPSGEKPWEGAVRVKAPNPKSDGMVHAMDQIEFATRGFRMEATVIDSAPVHGAVGIELQVTFGRGFPMNTLGDGT